ncbi:U4/U6 small nuclear ribonucleoprotein Prp31 [Gossypium australe]|uniref:U4/U6 small nuclear ribonucleoprotein Prp31 n=1 Tax=Gossypium australe TaxID=47621 RepID=A0A5B6W8F8_9ROSI|nr:U4/U6 small nuclear ribonucleoprotein Prp31 [Gossypium australe]
MPTFDGLFLLPKTFVSGNGEYMCKFLVEERTRGKRHSMENVGLGFRSLAHFNLSTLSKQGWQLLNNPNSLVVRTLNAKYFPESIWAATGVLQDGLCWRVGTETKISVLDSAWVPRAVNCRIQNGERCHESMKVSDLIDNTNRV